MEDVVIYASDMVKITVTKYFYWTSIMKDHLICKDLVEPIQNKNAPMGKNANE